MANTVRRAPTRNMVSFAANIIRGDGHKEALENSLYNTDNMSEQVKSNMASELLRHPLIASAIECARRDVLERATLDKAAMVENLENVVNADLTELVEFIDAELYDADGYPVRYTSRWRLRDDVDPRKLAAIAEIKYDRQGNLTFKLEPKHQARQQLIKIHGFEAPPKAAVGQDGKDAPAAILAPDMEAYQAARAAMLADDDC